MQSFKPASFQEPLLIGIYHNVSEPTKIVHFNVTGTTFYPDVLRTLGDIRQAIIVTWNSIWSVFFPVIEDEITGPLTGSIWI